jgi:hypothetical protein
MLVTLSGIVTDFSDEQPRKAPPAMLVTLLPIIYSVTCSPKTSLKLELLTIVFDFMVTDFSDEQFSKAQFPILLTPSGIVIVVSDEQL